MRRRLGDIGAEGKGGAFWTGFAVDIGVDITTHVIDECGVGASEGGWINSCVECRAVGFQGETAAEIGRIERIGILTAVAGVEGRWVDEQGIGRPEVGWIRV